MPPPTVPAAVPAPRCPLATAANARSSADVVHFAPVAKVAYSFLLARMPPAPAGCRPPARQQFVPKLEHIAAACPSPRPLTHQRTAPVRSAIAATATTPPDDKTAVSPRSAVADSPTDHAAPGAPVRAQ